MPHRLLLAVGRQSQLTEEPAIGVCSVLTAIREEALIFRRNKIQPVRQRIKQRRIYREPNEACTASSRTLERKPALGLIWSFVFVRFSRVQYFNSRWLRSLSLTTPPKSPSPFPLCGRYGSGSWHF